MDIAQIVGADIPEARHVEVLTAAATGHVVGYRVQGGRPGPTLLVAGHAPYAGLIYDRLLSLPTLPWLRGTLCLVILEALEGTTRADADDLTFRGPIDEVLFMPYAADLPAGDEGVREGYWTILRLCGRLGMIDGRGVFRQH